MINILFIESGTGWGGSSAYLYSFLKNLNKEKFNPIVFLYRNGEGPFVKDIQALGIRYSFFKKQEMDKNLKVNFAMKSIWLEKIKKISEIIKLKGILKSLLKILEFIRSDIPEIIQIKRIIKQERINVIFLNNDPHYHIPGVLAARLAHIPCVCRKAGIGGGARIKKILSRYVDIFISSSQGALKDYYREVLPMDKVKLIYGGVDFGRFNSSLGSVLTRRQLNIQDDNILVGSIARVAPGKGQFELLEAIPRVIKECPQIRFIIVGDDVEKGGRLLSELRLRAESMGKPTVVTDNWGLAETTENGITGYIIPPLDSDALARAIIDIASNSEKRHSMGQKAKERAVNLFDIAKNVKLTEEIIQNIIGQHLSRYKKSVIWKQ